MLTTAEERAKIKAFEHARSWFIGLGVALAFCLLWAIVGESDWRVPAATVAFVFFLRAGVQTEMAERAIHGGGH